MELEFLRKIGLTEGEIKVYSAVLELGISSLNKIHEKTAIERRNIYDILNKLIEKGLVSYTIEKGKKTFQITHPNKILGYLEDKKIEIEDVEKEITPKIPNLIKLFEESKTEIRAEVFRGNEAIKALLEEALNYKENFWLGGNCGLDKYFTYWWKHYDEKRIKKKVFWYDLADYGLYLSKYEKEKLYAEQYYELRFLPKDLSSPLVIFIFGNKVTQILWGKQSFAFVLESKEIKESFMKYFKYFWERAKKE
jgi:predicted DNA-binding transcriptional regulator